MAAAATTPILYTEAELNDILENYKKYWDPTNDLLIKGDTPEKFNLLKNLDVTYLSSNHENEEVRKIFNELNFKITIDKNVNDTYSTDAAHFKNLLDKTTDNWENNLYNKLLDLEKSNTNTLKINHDSYIIIDLSNEIQFLLLSTIGSVFDGQETTLKKLLELNNHNIFGIQYMIHRIDKFKSLNLSILPSTKLNSINSRELFKIKHKLNLIDNLFKKDNYHGEGDKSPDNKQVIWYENSTLYSIILNLKNYIEQFMVEYETEIEKIIPKLTGDNKFIINGEGKKIYMIGDIHGDFPRFVQLLYNAKFINFEGPEWAKLDLLDSKEFEKYINSTDIFKEVVWLPENVLLLSTGDLVDSKRENNSTIYDADKTGNYELRVHLLIFLLREQAMKKNSFVHFIIGNHDRYLLHGCICPETSLKSCNLFFKSYMNRFYALKFFYKVGLSSYAFIKIKSAPEEFIFTAHGSLFFKMEKFDDFNYNNINDFRDIYDINCIVSTSADATKILKFKNIEKLDIDRDTINMFENKYNDSNIDGYIENLNLFVEAIVSDNATDYDKLVTDNIDPFLDYLKNKNEYSTILNSLDELFKKYKDGDKSVALDFNNQDEVTKILKENSKQIIDDVHNIFYLNDTNYDKSVSLNFIKQTNSNIKYSVFGHQITLKFEDILYEQCKLINHHNILSVCGCKLNFIDIALSEAFNKQKYIFFELFHFGDDKTPSRLRIYTSEDRYMLGAPLPAEIYGYQDINKLIPELNDAGTPNTF